MLLFVSVARAATTAVATPQSGGLLFSMEHVITAVLSFVFSFAFVGILAPIIVSKYIKKVETRDDALKLALTQRDKARDELDKQWHTNVENMFKGLTEEVKKYCASNGDEHLAIWQRVNSHAHRITCPNRDCHGVEIGIVELTENTTPFNRRSGDVTK